jgi:hypothetical protein
MSSPRVVKCEEILAVQSKERPLIYCRISEDFGVRPSLTSTPGLLNSHNIAAARAESFHDRKREVLVGEETKHFVP